ncbi:MAG TPA: thiol-disulfide isomerase [Bryobacteraceae bacterium]|nr:thiol-disulfide isomerase [Bryobacteraceae bacterium]
MRLLLAFLGLGAVALSGADATSASPVTFNKDVLPILQKNCQTCHRPGQMAPMSFLSYQSTRPWAKAMKTAVATRKMPPWSADPHYGPYLNDHSLKQTDIATIAKWADSGAPEGNAKDAPPPVQWTESWVIQPDIVVDGPVTDVPAQPRNNVIEWRSVVVPSGFTRDTWVTSVQIKSEYPAVTHHICAGYVPHNPAVKYGVPVWQDKERDQEGAALPEKGDPFLGGSPQGLPPAEAGTILQAGGVEDCYLPGNPAADYRTINAAKLIPAGYDVVFSLHYTPNGTAVTDHVKIAFTTAKAPPQRRYISFVMSAPTDGKSFAIPPHDPNWQSPPAVATFLQDAELVFMMAHMHFRGKDTTWTLEFPDGTRRVVLNIPRYDFNWQLGYNTAIQVPKGTKLRVDAHYDNSVNNKFNPNPNRTVYYGQMTWEEMMSPFFGVVVNSSGEASKIVTSPLLFSNGG